MSSLLRGVRVLEFGPLMSSAVIGMFLGDFGADVIKIENPLLGDYARNIGGVIAEGVSTGHVQRNKNKRSLTLNLKSPSGREVFWRLLATADVFVDGTIAGSAEKLGIGYEEQRARKPDIIYCQYSGFGATGPYSSIPTHGLMMGALAAQEPHVMGDDGFMRHAPYPSEVRSGGEAATAGGVHAALGIAAALVNRERRGEGAHIDVAASDAAIRQAWINLSYALNAHLVSHNLLSPKNGTEYSGARHTFYETRDSKVVIFCSIETKFWRNFCTAVGRLDLYDQSDESKIVDYGNNDVELRRTLQEIFHTRDQAEWLELAATHDVCLGAAPRNLDELRADPHVQARGMIFEDIHPLVGAFTYIDTPIRVAGQSDGVDRYAPAHGEHTEEILAELGLKDEIPALRADGVIA